MKPEFKLHFLSQNILNFSNLMSILINFWYFTQNLALFMKIQKIEYLKILNTTFLK